MTPPMMISSREIRGAGAESEENPASYNDYLWLRLRLRLSFFTYADLSKLN